MGGKGSVMLMTDQLQSVGGKGSVILTTPISGWQGVNNVNDRPTLANSVTHRSMQHGSGQIYRHGIQSSTTFRFHMYGAGVSICLLQLIFCVCVCAHACVCVCACICVHVCFCNKQLDCNLSNSNWLHTHTHLSKILTCHKSFETFQNCST